jgi:SPP1 family holin
MESTKIRPTAGTVARTICLVLALVNQLLSIFGKSPIPINDNDIEQLVSLLFVIGAASASWWKNNSVTQNAILADAYLKELKDSNLN